MHVVAYRTLRLFWEANADIEDALREWYTVANAAKWHSPSEIKALYPSASILPDNRVVFNIKGNTYRLVIRVNYLSGAVFIRFIGTHSSYDKIDAGSI